jgi:hypothetical protein
MEVGGFSQSKAMREMQRIMRVQEPLFAFVLECSSDLSQDAHELALYMGVVIFRMYEGAFGRDLARAEADDVVQAHEANVQWIEQTGRAHERVVMERILPNLDISQPAVLEYVGDCIFDPEDETLEIPEEEQGQLFLLMKTFVDVLDRCAARQRTTCGGKTRPRKKRNAPPVYQIKVSLDQIRPPVWRRLLVPGDVSLATLHEIIQIAVGWGNCHLHEFDVDGECIGMPDPESDFGPPTADERRVKLAEIAPHEKMRFSYTYDFGDDWRHTILVEKILPPDSGLELPVCVKGKRACPPEDCGGPWGYTELIEQLADPDHPEHEEMLEWVGGEWNAEDFDPDQVNQVLRDLIVLPG